MKLVTILLYAVMMLGIETSAQGVRQLKSGTLDITYPAITFEYESIINPHLGLGLKVGLLAAGVDANYYIWKVELGRPNLHVGVGADWAMSFFGPNEGIAALSARTIPRVHIGFDLPTESGFYFGVELGYGRYKWVDGTDPEYSSAEYKPTFNLKFGKALTGFKKKQSNK